MAKDVYDIFKQCRHPAVIASDFSTEDCREFTKDDWVKADHLAEKILQLKINPLSKVCHAIFGFPFQYESIWIEGCNGYERK